MLGFDRQYIRDTSLSFFPRVYSQCSAEKSQTFLRRAITPAPAPAPLLSPAPLPQPSLGPANVPAPASNLPAAASNLPGPAPNLLAPASIPHKDTGPAPHLLGPYWQDGPTALPSTAPQPLTTSELKQTPTVAPSSHVILPTLPKPVSEASSPGTPHGLEPQASQPMFSLPRSAVPEKLPLPVLLHRPQAPLPSPEQKTEDRPTLSPEPITGPSYDQAAGPQNQSKIQPSPDQAISYTGQHAPMSAHWQQLIRPSAPALPTLQQSQDSISIPTSSYSESPRSAIEPSSSPIGLPGLQDHQLDLSSAQSQPQVDQQHGKKCLLNLTSCPASYKWLLANQESISLTLLGQFCLPDLVQALKTQWLKSFDVSS